MRRVSTREAGWFFCDFECIRRLEMHSRNSTTRSASLGTSTASRGAHRARPQARSSSCPSGPLESGKVRDSSSRREPQMVLFNSMVRESAWFPSVSHVELSGLASTPRHAAATPSPRRPRRKRSRAVRTRLKTISSYTAFPDSFPCCYMWPKTARRSSSVRIKQWSRSRTTSGRR